MAGAAGLLRVPRAAESGRVIGCLLTVHQRSRVIDALRTHAVLSFVDTFGELVDILQSGVDSIDVVIVPAHDREGRSIAEMVRRIAAQRPRVAIVAYCPSGLQYSADIRMLAAAGVHQVALAGVMDEGIAFRHILAKARLVCAAEAVMQELESVVPPLLHRVVEAIVSRPQEVTTLPRLADHLGVHRKTLFNWCARARFLPPAEVLAWSRLVLVGHHLAHTGCTVETIAFEMGYPSDNALRNALKRYTGMTAMEVRRAGGSEAVIAGLRRRLQQKSTLHKV
jgi:AraC-like DNA-binding protein